LGTNSSGKVEEEEETGPGTLVIQRGGDQPLKQLVADMRLVLSPNCAMKLKVKFYYLPPF
jgi:hypothetical protein